MTPIRFECTSSFQNSAAALWSFHKRSDALALLSPPLSGFRVIEPGDGIREGSLLVASVGFGPFRSRWRALHCAIDEGRSFTDVALESPFRHWLHQHHVEALPDGGSRLRDVVWYVPPAWIPRPVARPAVNGILRVLFAWRHGVTRRTLAGKSVRCPLLCLSTLEKGA